MIHAVRGARIWRRCCNVPAMRHDTLLFVLVPLYLVVVGALVVAQMPREQMKPVAIGEKAKERRAPVVDKLADAGPQADESSRKVQNCENELRRTAELLRFFANRIQTGEDTQSVVADMRQQEKKISAACE